MTILPTLPPDEPKWNRISFSLKSSSQGTADLSPSSSITGSPTGSVSNTSVDNSLTSVVDGWPALSNPISPSYTPTSSAFAQNGGVLKRFRDDEELSEFIKPVKRRRDVPESSDSGLHFIRLSVPFGTKCSITYLICDIWYFIKTYLICDIWYFIKRIIIFVVTRDLVMHSWLLSQYSTPSSSRSCPSNTWLNAWLHCFTSTHIKYQN